ncbi:MAG: GNAT family protein [Planctomycetota bacterium]|nr:GNAT family protein [Planctomycetota bacterium]
MHLIVNEKITLTEFRPTDQAACVEYLSDKDIYDRTLRIPHPYTAADFDRWLRVIVEATEQHGEPVHFAVRNAAGSLIGGCGFEELAKGHLAQIGYWLAKPYWSQGIMTAVVGKACEHAFTQWKLVRITAYVFYVNVTSARVLEKNGFTCEGNLRKHFLKDRRFLDSKLYALVR